MCFKGRKIVYDVYTYGSVDIGVGAGVDALEVVQVVPFGSAFFLACLALLFVIVVGRKSVRAPVQEFGEISLTTRWWLQKFEGTWARDDITF